MTRLNRYEVLILASPEITGDEALSIERSLEKVVKDAHGSFISFDRWGKYKLAYPVRKNDYGVYFLARFETTKEYATALLKELDTLFSIKLADLIMRHMVSRLDPRKSLEYQRPQSLEEIPTRDVDSFLRDKKIDYSFAKEAEVTEMVTFEEAAL